MQLKGFLAQATVFGGVFPGSAAKHTDATAAGVQESQSVSPARSKTYQVANVMLYRHAKNASVIGPERLAAKFQRVS